MMHAASLGVVPELWVGDFDSAGSELTLQYREVPRETFPAEKDATDGDIAVSEAIRRGAREIILLGGLGGQTDHAAGLLGQSIAIARKGISCLLTSGMEEAWPLVPGRTRAATCRRDPPQHHPLRRHRGPRPHRREVAAREPRRAARLDADALQRGAGAGRDHAARAVTASPSPIRHWPPMSDVSLRIERMGRRGEGVARDQDRTVYVPGTLPGEEVTASGEGERLALQIARPRITRPCRALLQALWALRRLPAAALATRSPTAHGRPRSSPRR